ncbi:YczE/YyaS/YitT family protein [Suttonella ornithocola]|uniref:Uncharacterized BCR, YitT family COG1284 n=1 Tax=Suttonella ornithocola TaxID=279832 RepID=A0A380MXX2_9GAMM|nr:hypothetical protein [Suttonella ornithocola]SUO96886.1 Uncharacterized BCR, YitT family COG1284 [Suttonella ornithocola]
MKTSRVLPPTPWTANHLWHLKPRAIGILCLALILFGLGEALLILANLGATPWSVLAQGISRQTSLSIALATLWISVIVFLLWLPLKLRPGLATIINIFLVAFAFGIFLRLISPPITMTSRIFYCLLGILTIGIASAFYLTCRLGTGPRDGLMIGICEKTNWQIGIVRSLLEITVCLLGWLMGGVVGIGTLLFAFGIGWVVQIILSVFFRLWRVSNE